MNYVKDLVEYKLGDQVWYPVKKQAWVQIVDLTMDQIIDNRDQVTFQLYEEEDQ